jgi:hypothetical protein
VALKQGPGKSREPSEATSLNIQGSGCMDKIPPVYTLMHTYIIMVEEAVIHCRESFLEEKRN